MTRSDLCVAAAVLATATVHRRAGPPHGARRFGELVEVVVQGGSDLAGEPPTRASIGPVTIAFRTSIDIGRTAPRSKSGRSHAW